MSNKNQKKKNTKGFSTVGDLIGKYKSSDEDKYVSREFQKYGYELAKELGDLKNKSLYIKLAKDTPRRLLEDARSFVVDAQNVKNVPALFLWKLKKLKQERKKQGTKEQKNEKTKE